MFFLKLEKYSNSCPSFFPIFFLSSCLNSMSISALATSRAQDAQPRWVTSANQVRVSDRLASQLSQNISRLICRRAESLFTFRFDSRPPPVSQSKRLLVTQVDCQSAVQTVGCRAFHQLSTVSHRGSRRETKNPASIFIHKLIIADQQEKQTVISGGVAITQWLCFLALDYQKVNE